MKNRLLFYMICITMLISFKCVAQELKFEQGLRWKEIKEKAKLENRYIFLDLFATWCSPCKKMDDEVYSNPTVGNFINGKFISVKVQMDRTRKDNEFVKSWYNDAQFIEKEFKVSFYPTYVFLSPNGELVHISGGYQAPDSFIATAQSALDPKRNMAGMMNRFKDNTMRLDEMPLFAKSLKNAGQKEMANKVAEYYMNNYLGKLPQDSLLNPSHLNFIFSFGALLKPDDDLLNVFYSRPSEVDRQTTVGMSAALVNFVIMSKMIQPILWKDNRPIVDNPDWVGIYNDVNAKFGKTHAEGIMNRVKLIWFEQHNDWGNMISTYIEKIETQGIDLGGLGSIELNNVAYNVFFKHCEDKKILNKVAGWVKSEIDRVPDNYNAIDTYAGLLYKVGNTKDALLWQEKALKLAVKNSDKESEKLYRENIKRMVKKEQTW